MMVQGRKRWRVAYANIRESVRENFMRRRQNGPLRRVEIQDSMGTVGSCTMWRIVSTATSLHVMWLLGIIDSSTTWSRKPPI